MDHTENHTTQVRGDCLATVICDSERDDVRIVSVECVYPRLIHAEVLRHRAHSNSVSSSRATPVATLIKDCTYTPRYWTLNQPGMVGKGGAPEHMIESAKTIWNNARSLVTGYAQALSDLGFHKQHVNRLLEPFSYVRHLITATDLDNFFVLRMAEDADPVIQDLARAFASAMARSTTKESSIHVPYVAPEEIDELGYDFAQRVSAARCARVSYMKHNGKKPTLDEDVKLYERLAKSGHWSPMEHTATFVDAQQRFANFQGWQSLRNVLGR